MCYGDRELPLSFLHRFRMELLIIPTKIPERKLCKVCSLYARERHEYNRAICFIVIPLKPLSMLEVRENLFLTGPPSNFIPNELQRRVTDRAYNFKIEKP